MSEPILSLHQAQQRIAELEAENAILRTEKHADAEAIGALRGELNDRGIFSGPMIDSVMREADDLRSRVKDLEAVLDAAEAEAGEAEASADYWYAETVTARADALREAASICLEYSKDHGAGMFDIHSAECERRILALIEKEPQE